MKQYIQIFTALPDEQHSVRTYCLPESEHHLHSFPSWQDTAQRGDDYLSHLGDDLHRDGYKNHNKAEIW